MPMISSRGLLSSRGFGQFGALPVPPVGTFGFVYIYPRYWNYSFANDTGVQAVTTSGNLSTSSGFRLSAIANGVKGWFILRPSSTGINYASRIPWSSLTSSKSYSLAQNTQFSVSTAVGNNSLGIITVNTPTGTTPGTNAITHSNETIAVGGNLLAPSYGGSSVSTSDHGLFSMTSAAIKQTNKYAFADGTATTGTNITLSSYFCAAAIGNAAFGIFSQAGGTANTSKYTHADDTTAVGSNLTATYQNGIGGWNNDVTGILGMGSSISNKWSFASNTSTGVTNFTSAGSGSIYGTSNGIPGVSA